jgi:hypothetical protein
MADVVPLRRRGAPEFSEPADYFVDAADPARALRVCWSPDHESVQLGFSSAEDAQHTLVLPADEVLELIRALVDGLPDVGGRCSRPPAPVLPLTPPDR